MATREVQALKSKDSVNLQKDFIRRRFLESVSGVLLVLAVLGLPLSLLRVFSIGFHFNHLVHICTAMVIFVVFALRKRLSDGWFIALVISVLTTLSLSAFLQYGVVSAGFYFSGACIFVAGVCMGIRGGVICTAFYATASGIIAYLWISGVLVFPTDVREYILLPAVWGTLGISFLVTTGIFYVSATGFFSGLTDLVDTVNDQKKKIEERTEELSQKNRELKAALNEIKTLNGLLPICSKCKKIRDDKGYWQAVEKYVEHHTDAEFTHSVCPDCIKDLYPEVANKVLVKKGEK